ncbi:TPA: restriction endonuclease subunit S [Campylobacter jejuni]|nr:restriction endonuclease subunit S [Campylobacter jejuni]HEF3970201.1 restriction endonuclease subunit S [Campylobacter jejuni]HEG5585147.1 restriction endonuclease subunit S [Campylobacter jejuni]HEG6058809.1 restriction endonuclease subunit S [Campylobacter jejuni]
MKSKVLVTSNWKEFKLEDLFEIGGSKTTPKKTLEEIGNGNYPYITTQATENGVAGYYNFYTDIPKKAAVLQLIVLLLVFVFIKKVILVLVTMLKYCDQNLI